MFAKIGSSQRRVFVTRRTFGNWRVYWRFGRVTFHSAPTFGGRVWGVYVEPQWNPFIDEYDVGDGFNLAEAEDE